MNSILNINCWILGNFVFDRESYSIIQQLGYDYTVNRTIYENPGLLAFSEVGKSRKGFSLRDLVRYKSRDISIYPNYSLMDSEIHSFMEYSASQLMLLSRINIIAHVEALSNLTISSYATSFWNCIFYFDIFFYIFEAALVSLVYMKVRIIGDVKRVIFANFVWICSDIGISVYELLGITSTFLILSLIAIFWAGSEDDSIELLFSSVTGFILFSIIGILWGLRIIKGYYSLSSTSSFEPLRKAVFADVINFILCLIRVILCISRYMFYDLQVENIDVLFQYTENIGSDNAIESGLLIYILIILLSCIVDLFFYSFHVIINLFKFGIAFFLLWLILDLILLRVDGVSTQNWLEKLKSSFIKFYNLKKYSRYKNLLIK